MFTKTTQSEGHRVLTPEERMKLAVFQTTESARLAKLREQAQVERPQVPQK